MPRVRPSSNNVSVKVTTQPSQTSVSASTTNSTNPVKASNSMAKYWSDRAEEYAESAQQSATDAINAKNTILNNEGFIAVSSDLDNINSVANDLDNIDGVASSLTNIDIVATNIEDVDTVATNISDVNDVANDLTNINSVSSGLTNIDTVATNISNIDTISANISYVNTVANISSDVTIVAGINSDVTTVASNISDVGTVATNITDVGTVADDIINVNAVASDLSNIDTIAGSIADISTVADSISDVSSVAGSISNVNSVASNLTAINSVNNNSSNINSVAGDLTNINAVANDLTNIDNASANAQLSKDWANKMNGTVDGVEFSAKYYAQQASQNQIQANWNETDSTSKAYIQNKPTIVKSVNNEQPDSNGNVTITIPDSATWGNITGTLSNQTDLQNALNLKANSSNLATVATSGSYNDLSNKPTIPAAQIQSDWNQSSSSATDYIKNKPTVPDDTIVSGWGYVKNTATATDSLTLLGKASSNIRAINIGVLSKANNSQGISIGYNAEASSGIAIGHNAKAVSYSIQLGEGSSPFANTFNVGFGSGINYCLLDASTGLIPDARLNLKTINGNSIKGTGDLTVSGLPSQTGHSGDVLTTDGTDASWADTTEVYPVIAPYINGGSWYRIEAPDNTGYRWCRMGGLYYKGSTMAATDNTITFLKTFKDLNYTFTPTPMHSDANLNQYQIYEKYTERTTSSTVLRITSAIFGYEWIAEGYIKNET